MVTKLDGYRLSKAMRDLEASKTPEERRAAFLRAAEAIEERAGELLRRSRQLLKETEAGLGRRERK